MKNTTAKRVLASALTGAMALSLAACGGAGTSSAATGETGAAGTAGTASAGTPTITLYPSDGNLSSGTVTGFKGDYFAERGFALDVWAYSDEKTNAILASGDLPDVMYVPMKDLDTMINAGMLLNLDDYLDQMPSVQAYEPMENALNYVKEFKSAGTGSVYALPLSVGKAATPEYTDATERNALKLNWAAYEAAGAPEITSMDDVLPVMQEMLTANPTNADGTACYGTILNSGFDTTFWSCMTIWYRAQGYLEKELPYLLESNMVEGTNTSILSKDSMYYKGLQWYNQAYQMGLIDPDSINNDRATQSPKVQSALAMVPTGSLPGWAPNYQPYYVPDTKLYFNNNTPYGSEKYMIAINAKTQNVDACLAFVDMLADADAYLVINQGPEGEFWQSDDQGDAYFTDAALEHLKTADVGDFTGFTLASGEKLALWNTPHIVTPGAETSYGDGKGGKRMCRSNTWEESELILTDNDIFHSWQKTTGYQNWPELLADKDAYVTTSALDYISTFESIPDDTMQLTVDAIKDKVVTASWKMVYAADQTEFDAQWDQMIADCEGLGAQSVIDWRLADIENAITVRDSLNT